jgi:SIR2-like domain
MIRTRTDVQRERLLKMLMNKQAALVFGTGITVQATKKSETSSWVGLLQSGIDHCVGFADFASNEEGQKWAEARLAELRDPDPKSYMKVAGEIERALKDLKGERKAWLQKAIGDLKIRDASIMEAIKGLVARFKNPVILTTNYDTLLSEALDVDDVTWEQVDDVIKILRRDSPNVLHIHGLWSKPDTVVLGTESYEGLLQNKAAQALQQTFPILNTLIFIGCGDGVRDDNIGALLKWYETALPERERHIILLPEEEARKFPNAKSLMTVSYGQGYGELPGFLNSLMPVIDGEMLVGEVMDGEAMQRQVDSAKALISRLADAWTQRNQKYRDEAILPSKSVAGVWSGQQTQQTGPADEPITYPVALELVIEDAAVTGIFSFEFGPEGLPLIDESLKVKGQLDQGRFLRLAYEGVGDDNLLQFGTLLLELSADGDVLIGNDVGYGYTTRQTLTALTRLRRSTPP